MGLIYFAYAVSLSCLFLFKNHASGSYVPTILWNIKGNSLNIKPVSTFGNDQQIYEEAIKNMLTKDSSTIVFTLNSLSLEDFSAVENPDIKNNTLHSLEMFLDLHPNMLLSSVKDPLDKIHNAHCGVEEIMVDQALDSAVLRLVSSAIDRSCAVILHLSDSAINGKKNEIKDIFLPSLVKTNKNVAGIFTGMKSSWEVSNAHHRFRRLLAVDDGIPDFVNFTGCIIMYAENSTLKIGNETYNLPFPPELTGSSCSNESSELQLTYNPQSDVSKVVINFSFNKTVFGNWKTNQASLKITGGKVNPSEMELVGKLPDAPLRFSYSCGHLRLEGFNTSLPVALSMLNFQIQPYEVGDKFGESFDCVPFFTIPIWMGIFVAILFIVIMNIGIYALFSIHTMDRFDDPKGKSIMVPATLD